MVITNAQVVTFDSVENVDVKIVGGKIVEIDTNLSGERVIDAKGAYLLPSFIDIGVKPKDAVLRGGTLEQLAKKAVNSGFGTIALNSFCDPRIDNEVALEFIKSEASMQEGAAVIPLGAGIKADGSLSNISILCKNGICGIEFDSCIDGNLIRRLMEYGVKNDIMLFCHANDTSLQGDGVIFEGDVASKLGLAGVPAVIESSQVARISQMASFYGADVTIMAAAVPQTIHLCMDNDHLHSQCSIHHLLLDERACMGYETSGKLWPPLLDKESKDKLRIALKNGYIDMLTSLHTPVSESAKDAVFAEAAFGIDAMESFIPLCYTYLVLDGLIDMPSLCRICAKNPADAIGLGAFKGMIAKGYDADLILFDPDIESVITDNRSPYYGYKCKGEVKNLKEA